MTELFLLFNTNKNVDKIYETKHLQTLDITVMLIEGKEMSDINLYFFCFYYMCSIIINTNV